MALVSERRDGRKKKKLRRPRHIVSGAPLMACCRSAFLTNQGHAIELWRYTSHFPAPSIYSPTLAGTRAHTLAHFRCCQSTRLPTVTRACKHTPWPSTIPMILQRPKASAAAGSGTGRPRLLYEVGYTGPPDFHVPHVNRQISTFPMFPTSGG